MSHHDHHHQAAPPRWPAERAEEVRYFVERYPDSRSAVGMLLHLAMEERGYVDRLDIEAVAKILDLTPAYVESFVSFYAMYHRHPIGKYILVVCTNLSCHVCGASVLMNHLQKALGIKNLETTPDGLFTLEGTAECLAACDAGPVLQVNTQYFLRVDPAKADAIIAALRAGDKAAIAALAEHPEAAGILIKDELAERTA